MGEPRNLPSDKDDRTPRPALLRIVIDNLPDLRAVRGSGLGDALLDAMADRLGRLQGVRDVARVPDDGDALSLWLDAIPPDRLEILSRQVQDTIRRRLELGTATVHLTASIGISQPRGGAMRETLLRQAGIACLNARAEGGNRRCYYLPEMQNRLRRQTEISQGLHDALNANLFTLTFQPQFALLPTAPTARRCHSLIGAEALLRWKSPSLGPVGPAEFIPVAERTGMVREIDFHVMALFARQIGRWRARGHHLHASINLSSCSFADETLASRLLDLLAREGVDPCGISVEITETALLAMSAHAVANIERLRRAGITLSVDDFGSGYASLSYLRNLVVSEIKIDRSFILGLTTGEEKGREDRDCARVIVRTILDMARSLNIRALAEGVEFCEQMTWLHDQGCRVVQGHFLGQAVAPAAFEQWDPLESTCRHASLSIL